MSESVEQQQRVDRAAAALMEEWLGTNFVVRKYGPGPPNFEATAKRVLDAADRKPETRYELDDERGLRPATLLGKARCRIWALAHGFGWISDREFNV